MRRDIFIFLLAVTLIALFCTAGMRKISPAFSATDFRPTLILDAGHGGEDGGATTASGNKESDINLSIVLKLESLMAFLGIDSILTRNTDISIHDQGCETLREKKVSDLNNRVSLIHNTPGAMVISVHQNTFTDPAYQGSQVFYGCGEISVQWGEYTQELLRISLDKNNNRKAAPIPAHVYLFKNIECPAILVECGFLSNGEDAALLMTDTYQRKIAVALAGSYFHQLQMIPVPLGGDCFVKD